MYSWTSKNLKRKEKKKKKKKESTRSVIYSTHVWVHSRFNYHFAKSKSSCNQSITYWTTKCEWKKKKKNGWSIYKSLHYLPLNQSSGDIKLKCRKCIQRGSKIIFLTGVKTVILNILHLRISNIYTKFKCSSLLTSIHASNYSYGRYLWRILTENYHAIRK